VRLLGLRLLGRTGDDPGRRVGEARIDRPDAEVAGALRKALRAVADIVLVEEGLREAPERGGAEAERKEDQ
jgi:hypothetical protein